ncbi:MAG: response regulator [Bacteroidetes bacterium]|nr:response regulator [Bacteroidota bacterium]
MKNLQNVIIVDDDPSNNLLCKTIIKRVYPDAEIKSFLKAEDGLVFIAENYSDAAAVNPSNIFLDINMPLMNGWEFLDEFEKFPDFIKTQFTIYMLSSSIDDSDKERAAANELVTGFISKPLSREIISRLFG